MLQHSGESSKVKVVWSKNGLSLATYSWWMSYQWLWSIKIYQDLSWYSLTLTIQLFFWGPGFSPGHGGQFSAPPGPNLRIRPRQLLERSACDEAKSRQSLFEEIFTGKSWSPGGESLKPLKIDYDLYMSKSLKPSEHYFPWSSQAQSDGGES